MTYRITGQSGLIDTDSLVSNTMKPYKQKVATKKQDQQILEWKQSQYRTIMKSSNDFLNKYLTVDGSSSLLSSKAYNSIKFSSSDDSKVAATSTSGASMDNYTIKVKTLAANATGTIADSAGATGDTQTITIGTGTGASNITFSKGATGSATVANYNAAVSARKTTLNNIATASRTADQQTELDYLNNNVINAQYNTINKGVVFTAAKAETGGFTLNGTVAKDQNLEAEITNSAGKIYTINSTTNTSYSNQVTVDGVSFNFNSPTTVASTSNLLDVIDVTNLKDSSLTNLANVAGSAPPAGGLDGTTTKTDAATGTTTTIVKAGAVTTTTTTNGATTTKTVLDNTDIANPKTTIITTAADGSKTTTAADGSKTTTAVDGTITTVTDVAGVKTITSPDGRTTVISGGTTTTTASDGRKTVTAGGITTTTSADGRTTVSDGTKTTTTSADGATITTTTGGIKTTTVSSTVKLTSSTDVTALKDRIKSFINDYNTLLSSINTKIYETRDKNYLPLTDDQKTAMKDTDITNWQNKAQTGLLRKDDDLENIAASLKDAMSGISGSDLISASGLTLEKLGIKPVDDYKEKNGTYTIADEDKLTKALQENLDGVKALFTQNYGGTDLSKAGIIPKVRDVIEKNLTKSDSVLVKKVGTEEYNTYNSELSKQITDMKNKIVEMNKDLDDREQNLYTKYSKLETALTKLQSQQSTLSSYFGSSNS